MLEPVATIKTVNKGKLLAIKLLSHGYRRAKLVSAFKKVYGKRRDLVDHSNVAISKLSSGPEVIKLFTCSTQLSMKFFSLINVKMPTIVGILTFMSRKNSILGLSESEKS